jgi:glutamate-1-semialdehyde aminotransferase
LARLKEEGPQLQEQLNARADDYAAELNRYFGSVNAPLKMANCGSMMNLTFSEDEPLGELLYSLLRLKGVFIWDARPSFLTLAHSDEDIRFVIAAFKEAVSEIMEAGLIGTAPLEPARPDLVHAQSH